MFLSLCIYADQEGELIAQVKAIPYTTQELMELDAAYIQEDQGMHIIHHGIMQRNFAIDNEDTSYVHPLPKLFPPQHVAINTLATTLAETRSFPPDTMGDVGPTQFIVACNGRVKTLSKTNGLPDGVLNIDLGVFFNAVRGGIQVSDPRIRYDKMTNRWFIICITVAYPNRILLAMSSSGTITPSMPWRFFFFDQSSFGFNTCLADYPTLGIDKNGLYIGVNQFCLSSTTSAPTFDNVHIEGQEEEQKASLVFVGSSGYVIPKASLVNNNVMRVFLFRNLINNIGQGPYSPQGVDNVDLNPPFGYFIGVNAISLSQLALVYIADVTTTPRIATTRLINIPQTQLPITVPHKGNNLGPAGYLDGLDDRLLYAHIRNNHLWTSHNIGVNNMGTSSGTITRDACRWYDIDLTQPTIPIVRQAGTVFTPSATNDFNQRHYWMGTLIPTGQGHMVLGCSAAGTNEFINAAFTTHLNTDPASSTRTPLLYTNSTTAYNPSSDPGGSGGRRWGDYSAVRLDPVDDTTVWMVQEYCDSTNSYGVRLAKILAPSP
jgi:hypothetical protein